MFEREFKKIAQFNLYYNRQGSIKGILLQENIRTKVGTCDRYYAVVEIGRLPSCARQRRFGRLFAHKFQWFRPSDEGCRYVRM